MFHRGGDRVPSGALPGERAAENRQVIRFGTAGGKKDGVRSRAEKRSHLPAGLLQLPFGGKADGMQRRGIAKALPHHIDGLIDRLRADRCGRAVVEIGQLQMGCLPFPKADDTDLQLYIIPYISRRYNRLNGVVLQKKPIFPPSSAKLSAFREKLPPFPEADNKIVMFWPVRCNSVIKL